MNEKQIEVWGDETTESVGERISDVMRRRVSAIIWYPSARAWWCTTRRRWVGKAADKDAALALVREALEKERG